jgi:hypothetical protein
MEMFLYITYGHGLTKGSLTDSFEVVERGLRVWFTMRQLAAIVLEFYDAAGKCVRAFEFPVTYDATAESSEHFDSKVEEMRSAVASMTECGARRYRLLVTFNTEDRMPVRGWQKCKRADVSDLKKVKLGDKVISTSAIKVDAFVFTGEDFNTGESGNDAHV